MTSNQFHSLYRRAVEVWTEGAPDAPPSRSFPPESETAGNAMKRLFPWMKDQKPAHTEDDGDAVVSAFLAGKMCVFLRTSYAGNSAILVGPSLEDFKLTHVSHPESSNIQASGYNADMQVLEVTFKNGGRYQYWGVPYAVREKMLLAESVGQFLNVSIKNVYPFEKLA